MVCSSVSAVKTEKEVLQTNKTNFMVSDCCCQKSKVRRVSLGDASRQVSGDTGTPAPRQTRVGIAEAKGTGGEGRVGGDPGALDDVECSS